MSEATKTIGVVRAKSQYGIKLEGNEDWFNWSKPEFIIGPLDKEVSKGDRVAIVVDGKYIVRCEKVESAGQEDGQQPDAHEPVENWSYKQKDSLILKETCINAARDIIVAEIAAGIIKSAVTPDVVHAFADQLESLCWETHRE